MRKLLKKFLFSLDPERAHHLALLGLQILNRSGCARFLPSIPKKTCSLMGLTFPNPIGLAAGFDKNGDYIDAIAALGFGFIEIGTITPQPQVGNPPPRLFRLPAQQAIINRMGFNNKGMEYVAKRLEQTHFRGILGINIGKNKATSLEKAVDDYINGFRCLWKFASYITINISSPNTPGLRDLQHGEFIQELLRQLKNEQILVQEMHKKYVPLVIKISPDLSGQQLEYLAKILLQEKMDGVIATNTTIERHHIMESPLAAEVGGLSGRPLQMRSTEVIRQLHAILQDKIPIIASGGVMDKASAVEKLTAGATLLQVYTGLIYHGIRIVKLLN